MDVVASSTASSVARPGRVADSAHLAPRFRIDRERAADLLARAFVGWLFLLMSINLLGDFMETQRVTGLLMLFSEGSVVVLTIVRRRARIVDRSAMARIVTALSLTGPLLLRAADRPTLVPDWMAAVIVSAGLCMVVAGKLTLGRSFGLVPANRGVVATGPYLLVRHPIYIGYLVTHVGFLTAHLTVWNVAVLLIADASLVVRSLREERVLGQDARYREYCGRVRWRLVPGVF